jgi:sec-independent protein translocase protein TatC
MGTRTAFGRTVTAPFRLISWFFRSIGRWLASIAASFHTFFTEEPEDEPLPDTFARTIENPQGLLVHLDALRKHLLRSVLAVAIATAFSFTFARQILEFLTRPVGGLERLRGIDVTEPIGTVMRVSLLTGFAIVFPYIALELWLFIAPGISRRSRLFGLFAIPVATIFFLGGMAFAYFVMMPTALPFLINFMGINTDPRPSSYIGFVTGLMFWIGVAFEFPLVIYLFATLGLVKASLLVSQWRLAIVVIAIISALITPTVDPVNMSLVMGPMIALYFLSIGLAFIAQRRRA